MPACVSFISIEFNEGFLVQTYDFSKKIFLHVFLFISVKKKKLHNKEIRYLIREIIFIGSIYQSKIYRIMRNS